MGSPNSRTTPSRGGRNPITEFMQVVLPAPFLPSSASTRPGASRKDTS